MTVMIRYHERSAQSREGSYDRLVYETLIRKKALTLQRLRIIRRIIRSLLRLSCPGMRRSGVTLVLD